jgi:hypothetical protein
MRNWNGQKGQNKSQKKGQLTEVKKTADKFLKNNRFFRPSQHPLVGQLNDCIARGAIVQFCQTDKAKVGRYLLRNCWTTTRRRRPRHRCLYNKTAKQLKLDAKGDWGGYLWRWWRCKSYKTNSLETLNSLATQNLNTISFVQGRPI